MTMKPQKYKNDCIIMNTIEELVPKEHSVRKIDNCIDFTFIEDLVKDLYSELGRQSIPPVVLFKLIFINIIYGINLMRRTCEESKVNLDINYISQKVVNVKNEKTKNNVQEARTAKK